MGNPLERKGTWAASEHKRTGRESSEVRGKESWLEAGALIRHRAASAPIPLDPRLWVPSKPES